MKDKIFRSNLICPNCKSYLNDNYSKLICPLCDRHYPIVEGIPDFRDNDEYWCNVDRDKMNRVIQRSRESGDWLSTVNEMLPNYVAHIVPYYRADAQFLFPIDKRSRILDAGSMWGGLTIPLAQFCSEVHAVDKTIETLILLDVRARQMGFDNIAPIAASVKSLPYPNDYFDLVILNGVLEWIGTTQDVVLEEHYYGRWNKITKYNKSPYQMQLEALQELYRVLKPNGVIYIAIENRIGIQYFLGFPDDHINVRFVTFLPRRIANFFTKLLKNSEYRTYIYSPQKLKHLVKNAGFNDIEFYSVVPNYRKINKMVHFDMLPQLSSLLTSGNNLGLKGTVITSVLKLLPRKSIKDVSPSLAVFAKKESKVDNDRLVPRLLNILTSAGILASDEVENRRYQPVIVNSRFGNDHSVNYLIYDVVLKRMIYFCKIGRKPEAAESLEYESNQLNYAHQIFNGTHIINHIPQLVKMVEVDCIPVQVTRYLPGHQVKNTFLRRLMHLSLNKGQFASIVKKYATLRRLMSLSLNRRFVLIVNKYATNQWLSKIDNVMRMAISFLCDFQSISTTAEVDAFDYLKVTIHNQVSLIREKNMLTNNIGKSIELLQKEIQSVKGLKLPLCMQHGDYVLESNFLISGRKINLVDFEHAQGAKLPFLDIAMLLFHSLLAQWRNIGSGQRLSDFARAYGWTNQIRKWCEYYSDSSKISMKILEFLPALAVLEQNAKNYPSSRDPYTFPMYGEDALDALLEWRL